MKRIINGKLYDTDTATIIGQDSFGYTNDFNHWKETLYVKKTGEYFLLGEGGANSLYREAITFRTWTSSRKIIPISLSQAKEWTEAHMSANDYINAFGEVDE